MAKRIATQLVEAIKYHIEVNTSPPQDELVQWHKWAKKLNASMRYDGSPVGKHKPRGKR